MDVLSPGRQDLLTTERLVDLALDTKEGDIPDEVYDVAKQAVLDGVATMLAGSREDVGRLTAQLASEMGGRGGATVIGTDIKTSPAYAAFTNAAAAHCLDYELMWVPPTHPNSPVLPSLFALAEGRSVSGKSLLAALIVSFEAQARLNLAIQDTPKHGFRFHPPSTIGMIGSALACSRLLGLDKITTRMAVGIAADRAGGLLVSTGSMTKSQHSAHAARSGVESALLAASGYTANPWVIEADDGFADAVFGEGFDFDAVTRDFGSPYRMVDPGFAIKLFPAQYTTHWSMEAALEVHNQPEFDIDAIRTIRVRVGNPNWSAPRPFPESGLAGKFSVPYTVAVALADGRVNIDSFTDERRFSTDIERLLPLIHVTEDPAIPPGLDFANTWSDLTVELADGTTLSAVCHAPRGRWDRRPTLDEHREKYRDCAARVLTDERVRQVEQLILQFDEIDDVGEFVALLGTEVRR